MTERSAGARMLSLADKFRSRLFVRYALVGCANSLVGLSVIFLCMGVLGLPPVPSNAIGYAVGLLVSYLLNRRFTFRSRVSLGAGAVRYVAVVACAYLLNLAVLLIAVNAFAVNVYLAQTLGIGVYFIAVFLGSSAFVFTDTRQVPPLDKVS